MALSDTPTLRPAPSLLGVMTTVSLAWTVLCLLWLVPETRLIGEQAVWVKPLKFAVSFVAFFGTLALVEAQLSPAARQGLTYRGAVAAMAVAAIAEALYITYQAARGEASHYNLSTPFHEIMYSAVMGTGAVLLVLGVAVVGWIAARDAAARLGPATRAGVLWGFSLTFVATLIVASTLAQGDSHHIGLHPPGGATMPLFGWSLETGDLRPAHFLSLHAMQALPLLGLATDRGWLAGSARTMPWAALGYGAVITALYAQALMDVPLLF